MAEKMGIRGVMKRRECDGGLKLRLWHQVYQYTRKVTMWSEKPVWNKGIIHDFVSPEKGLGNPG
jgi:hypothetical protein